jgi:hypothetical protein
VAGEFPRRGRRRSMSLTQRRRLSAPQPDYFEPTHSAGAGVSGIMSAIAAMDVP